MGLSVEELPDKTKEEPWNGKAGRKCLPQNRPARLAATSSKINVFYSSASFALTSVQRDCSSLSRQSSLPVRPGAQFRTRKDAQAVLGRYNRFGTH